MAGKQPEKKDKEPIEEKEATAPSPTGSADNQEKKKRKRAHPSERLKKAAEGCADIRELMTGEGSSNSGKRQKTGHNKFRLEGKNLYLTFPQCAVTKEQALERLKKMDNGDLWKFIIVGAEKHKDGNPHLHIVLQGWQRYRSRHVNCFDFVGGKHGNYQTARNLRKVIGYCTKDGDYIADGINVEEFIKSQKGNAGVWATVAQQVIDGVPLRQLEKGFFMQHKRKVQDYANFMALDKLRNDKLPWYGINVENLQGANYEIGQWLNANIKVNRVFKQPQLYIFGPKNMGKSTLVDNLGKYLSIYRIPPGEDFYDLYEDKMYDLAVIDEFKGQKQVQWLNEWLQGSPMCVRQKGTQTMKMQNIPTIILSNFPLKSCFPGFMADRMDTLECRLDMVEVTEFIDLDFSGMMKVDGWDNHLEIDEKEEEAREETQANKEQLEELEARQQVEEYLQEQEAQEALEGGGFIKTEPYDEDPVEAIFEEGRQVLMGTGMANSETEATEKLTT